MNKKLYKFCYHKWEKDRPWGVIIGVSRCINCEKLSRLGDFPIYRKRRTR